MKALHISILLVSVCLLSFSGCTGKQDKQQDSSEPLVIAKTPVIVAYPSDTIPLTEEVTINATASYLLKSDVKANATGYITDVHVKLADYIKKGQILFGIQTKEARALGNTINKLDSSFRFSGATTVLSPSTGYVEMLNHQTGDYIQDGDILATITDASSFGFVMDVPYEYYQLITINKQLSVYLPDGRELKGQVSKIIPSVDKVAQTQKVLVKVVNAGSIPENLIATIKLTKNKVYGLSVPKSAVLTNETQSSYWVMKLINDTTAIKTTITKGIETEQWVQVASGNLSVTDRIITSGNYGLNDTAYVQIQK